MRWLGVLCAVTAVAGSIHNNMIGQPEMVQLLGLSNDEENHLSPMPYSGTYHFVSSTFPDHGVQQRNDISNEIDSRGFHESVFGGIGDYYPSAWPGLHYKRSVRDYGSGYRNYRKKRSTVDVEKNLNETEVEKLIKRASKNRFGRGMEMGSLGFHGDVFNSGFGDFLTMKKRRSVLKRGADMTRLVLKMRSEKRRPEMDSMGFHGDTFGGGFGHFDTMKKRRPEMDSMGFHGDTFGGGFGDFDTMKKRRPEMDSMGFHGDTFGGGFGDFDTMKKRRPEMDSMGFHGDTFGGGFGDFDTMKKRRPEMDSMGFHGDTFGGGFGDFDTMKKRRPEMDSMGFHGDTFGGGFGDFDTMKKRVVNSLRTQHQYNENQMHN